MTNRSSLAALAIAATLSCSATAESGDSIMSRELSEVVVTGSNQTVNAKYLPYTVSIIDSKSLDNASSNQLLSILSGRVPSLFVTQRGILGFGVSSNGGSGHIKIRGVGGDRASAVLMMVDGQPQFAGLYSHHVADFYSKEYVERVEVLRGPASVLYGSNAMAGTINVITKQAEHRPLAGSLTTSYGSYNTWQSTATVSARHRRVSAMASVSYDHTDGNVKNFDFSQWSGYAKASYRFSDRWLTTADLTLMNFKANDPLYARLSNPESTDIYHQNIIRGEASLAATNSYSSTNGAVRAYYSWGNHFIRDPRAFHSLDDRFGVMAYQNIKPWYEADMTVGIDFACYSGEIPMSGGTLHQPGAIATMERHNITEYSPYLTLAQNLLDRRLTLNAGLRVANSSMFATRCVPQAGVVYNPTESLTLKASAAMGYRNPSFRELYLYKMANPDLEPERMWNYEVSAHKSFGPMVYVDLTLYYSSGSNMIEVMDMKNVNTGSFRNKGIEAGVGVTPLSNLSLTATYSYLHTSLDNLTGAPRHQYFLGADWRPMRQLTLSAQLRGIAHLFVAESIPYQSYALLDLKAQYQLLKYLKLFVNLDNITDASYIINRGYPMPGFTASGGFTLSF
ncbi:MAG: TonB-dependent receptor [Bacteroidales bacterium]|nr:TonB-dependent receptor [Bacteroidales bacterium]